MRVLLTIFLLTIGTILSVQAQKFVEVTKEMLLETEHPMEPDAEAAYLIKNVDIQYAVDNPPFIELTYLLVVKVYKEAGESYAQFEIPYYQKSGRNERIERVKATTYNLSGNEIVETNLSKKDIYKEETTEFYKRVKFAIPDVKSGSIFQLRYTKRTPYIYTVPKWYFQDYIPVNYSKYKIGLPAYFSLTPIATGLVTVKHDQKENQSFGYPVTDHKFVAENVKSCKEDKYVLNENDYRSSLKYEMHSVHFPGSVIQNFSKSWEEIGRNLMEENDFGDQLTKKISSLDKIVFKAKELGEEEGIDYLYNYVKNNFIWDEYYGYHSSNGLKKFADNKSGSIGDFNLLLINLLKRAGYNAYPLLLKSRGRGMLNLAFPSRSELNYVVAFLDRGGSYELLDASSKMTPRGKLPLRATSTKGVLILDETVRTLDLKNPNFFKMQTLSQYSFNLEDNQIFGSSQRKRSDYAATKYRMIREEDKYEDEDEDEESEKSEAKRSEEDDQEADIEQYNLENSYEITELRNLEDIDKPVIIKYDEILHTCSKVIDDKIFIDAALDFGLKKNPFTEDEREFPVFYNYKVSNSYIATLEIPKGYTVESIPERIALTLPEKRGSYVYEAKILGDKISITQIFKINELVCLPSDYLALKSFYELISKKVKEKIVLTRS